MNLEMRLDVRMSFLSNMRTGGPEMASSNKVPPFAGLADTYVRVVHARHDLRKGD